MKTVGFIGLGLMGKPMAYNLLKAGFPLFVHNRSYAPVEELVTAGAHAAFSPKEIADQCDVIITCLPDTPDVQNVVLGADGITASNRRGQIVIDMSTIDPAAAIEIAHQLDSEGIRWLDAPVSGGDVGAINGTLSIMVGGKKETFEECLDVFQAMGKRIVHVGEAGMGQITKACNQIIVAGTMAAMGEALVLAAKAGANLESVIEALSGGSARCWALEVRAPQILQRQMNPGFKASMQYKDLNIVLNAGKAFNVPLPLTGIVRELYAALMAADRGNLDTSGVVTVLEDLAHTRVQGGGQND
jgi:2-hydroxy-3-oxopropionate reductase